MVVRRAPRDSSSGSAAAITSTPSCPPRATPVGRRRRWPEAPVGVVGDQQHLGGVVVSAVRRIELQAQRQGARVHELRDDRGRGLHPTLAVLGVVDDVG
jgi:hypothetical protein